MRRAQDVLLASNDWEKVMAVLSLSLFGYPRVTLDGQHLSFARRSSLALLRSVRARHWSRASSKMLLARRMRD